MNIIIALLLLVSPMQEQKQSLLEEKQYIYDYNNHLQKKLLEQINREKDSDIKNTLINLYNQQKVKLLETKRDIECLQNTLKPCEYKQKVINQGQENFPYLDYP